MGGGGSKGANAAHRARYEAAMTQVERDKEHNEAMLLQQKEAANKLEHAFHEKAAVERAAHDEKLRLEREKSDLLKESAAANLILVQENHERQRLILKEAEDKRLESERIKRENEIRLREENEQKREMDRSAAREREDRAQREMTKAINDANREVNDMKDKAHADITKLVMENQKNKDDLMKENIKTMEAKDAANAEKLEKLTNTYQSQVKETQELAKQREDALHLERKAVDEKYRNDIEKMSKMSKEERDKMTADYHKIIEEKDNELSRNQREKDAKMDELNKNHLEDLREAHDNYNKLQETSKAEMMKLHKEKEEVIRESAAKQEEMAQKMLEMSERKNEQLFIMANEAIYAEARKAKEQSEILLSIKCNEELTPIKSIKMALITNATSSCELWMQMQERENDVNEIKKIMRNIVDNSQAIKRNIIELLSKIDACSSLGAKKKEWNDELKKLDKTASEYSMTVRREFRKEDTSYERLEELEQECEKLKAAILNLPDMQVESLEALINRNSQATITFAENRGVTKSIAAVERMTKIESIEGATGGEVVEEL